ncbi:MAG: hypothetical protein HYY68_07195 [Thaumarchaeota archaeon]|nr:hypothetical protein [Nitrososphaerota archaeon]
MSDIVSSQSRGKISGLTAGLIALIIVVGAVAYISGTLATGQTTQTVEHTSTSTVTSTLTEERTMTVAEASTITNTKTEEKTITITETVPQFSIALSQDEILGTFLTDSEGRTLYYFTIDIPGSGASSCIDSCIAAWPAFFVKSINVPPGLDASDFMVITRPDSAQQLAYRGWPLYYFANDNVPGDRNGEGLGNVWFVAKPFYSLMLLNNQALGQYFVDSQGRTLYYFANDVPSSGNSSCVDACVGNWPTFSVSRVDVPSTLDSSEFKTIFRADGTKQLTYKGWPLYYFAGDAKPGEANGEGLGKVWFVMKPSYTLMLANKAGIGLYIVDDRGRTLYYFAIDKPGVSNCSDACAAAWPPFNPATVEIPSTMNMSDFKQISRADGSQQLTFRDWPLYYFANDNKPGDTNGQGVGGVWFVIDPDNFPPS